MLVSFVDPRPVSTKLRRDEGQLKNRKVRIKKSAQLAYSCVIMKHFHTAVYTTTRRVTVMFVVQDSKTSYNELAPAKQWQISWFFWASSSPASLRIMTKDTLVDDRVSTSQITKATEALYAHETKKQAQKKETELLPGKEPNIWLNVTVKQVAVKSKIKPIKMCVH